MTGVDSVVITQSPLGGEREERKEREEGRAGKKKKKKKINKKMIEDT